MKPLRIAIINIHGLLKSTGLEIGRDADNGGQTRYVYEFAEYLSRHPDVGQVHLITRLIDDPALDDSYALPVEIINDKLDIRRIPFAGKRYRLKEDLWPYLDEFVTKTIQYLKAHAIIPDWIHSHYGDAGYAADVIAAWASRYLAPADPPPQPVDAEEPRAVEVAETGVGVFQQSVTAGPHRLIADEPTEAGGLDTGPAPYDLLLASLGTCTAMTLRLYADRKELPLTRVSVRLQHSKIHAEDCRSCETTEGRVDRIDRVLTLEGDLNDAQRARLREIADKCPVHRTLTSEIQIRTKLV